MPWKDRIRGGDRLSSSQINVGKFEIDLHQHINAGPDDWFCSCYGILDRHPLKSQTFETAKAEALAKVREVLVAALADIEAENARL